MSKEQRAQAANDQWMRNQVEGDIYNFVERRDPRHLADMRMMARHRDDLLRYLPKWRRARSR